MRFRAILLCLLLAFILTLPCPSIAQSRDPNKIYKVAILPFMIHSQENLDYLREGINDILTSRITVEQRVVVIERSIVERALYEEKPMRLDETAATKIGMRIGADYIVLGSITKIGEYISLDARLISIAEEKPPVTVYTQQKGIDDVMVKIGDFAQDIGNKILGRRAMAGRPGEPGYPSRGMIERFDRESVDFKRSQTFGFEIKGLAIGDVDGDKKNELVMMDTHNLYVFKYDKDKLSLLQKIETGSEYNFLTLDVADVNRNGVAEIIVTAVVEDNLRSFILEYEEGKFRKITEKAGWFYRVLDHPNDGRILVGQQMGGEGLPTGAIYRFVWKKNSFEKGNKMPFPRGTKIFGLAMVNFRSKETLDTLMLDDSDRLRMLSSDGKFSWKSGEQFGQTDNSYETKKKKDEVFGFRQIGSTPFTRIYIHGRIVIKDLQGDGLKEVIISKNNASSMLSSEKARSFTDGQVYSLVWNGQTFAINWKTRKIDGYISDYQIVDVDNDGEEELVVAVVDAPGSGSLGGSDIRSNILFFKLY
jgi:TolB-like protein